MSTDIYTIRLVGCASQKLKRPAPARGLYVSQLFIKASAYAELTCDRWRSCQPSSNMSRR
ncbi:UNVERIFIED_ORG: hypothetical protein J2X79_002715 [Arthrobacter globiformis]|nr:hypothetical protein [Arthrobacter globiformis]